MELNINEVLRYLGVKNEPPKELYGKVCEVADFTMKSVSPRFFYRMSGVEHSEDGVMLKDMNLLLEGETVKTMLEDCERAMVLACTLGAEFDSKLRRMQAFDMSRAVIFDACGSAWVESGLDEAEKEIKERLKGYYLTDRFSPGYGDFPLEQQKRLCDSLDSYRRLGISVTDSFLLNPVKSVSAVIGISERPQKARIRGCAFCLLKENCQFRKGGKTCGK